MLTRLFSFDCGVFTCAFLLHSAMGYVDEMPFTQVSHFWHRRFALGRNSTCWWCLLRLWCWCWRCLSISWYAQLLYFLFMVTSSGWYIQIPVPHRIWHCQGVRNNIRLDISPLVTHCMSSFSFAFYITMSTSIINNYLIIFRGALPYQGESRFISDSQNL